MAKNRVGRVERSVRRALIASNGKPISTSEIMRWAFPAARWPLWVWILRYWSVHRAARKFAVRAGKQGHVVVFAPN